MSKADDESHSQIDKNEYTSLKPKNAIRHATQCTANLKSFGRRLPLSVMPMLTVRWFLPNSAVQLPSVPWSSCLHNTSSTQTHQRTQLANNRTALQSQRDHRYPKQQCQPRFSETQQRSTCGHRFGPHPQYLHPSSSQSCSPPTPSLPASCSNALYQLSRFSRRSSTERAPPSPQRWTVLNKLHNQFRWRSTIEARRNDTQTIVMSGSASGRTHLLVK